MDFTEFHGNKEMGIFHGRRPISCKMSRPWNRELGWSLIMTVNSPSGSTCSVIRGSEMTCRWIRPVAAPCNVTHSSGTMTSNSPAGSTLQCGRWLWDDMPWNSLKRPPYWNSTSDFNLTTWPHHRSQHVILHQSAKFYPNRTTLSRKKWCHADFQDGGSQPS